MIWQNSVSGKTLLRPETRELCIKAFLNNHYCYRLNEVISQAEAPEHSTEMLNAGVLLYDGRSRIYCGVGDLDPTKTLSACS